MLTDLHKMYGKWSTANIRVRLRNDRERLKWWKTKTTQLHHKAEGIQLYSDHIRAMEIILTARRELRGKAA